VVFGQDGSFSYDALIGRYNSDLANGLGNLASRTLTMIGQYSGGVIPGVVIQSGVIQSGVIQGGANPEAAAPEIAVPEIAAPEIARAANQAIEAFRQTFERFEFSKGLEAVWALISAVDKYIVQWAPWKLARQQDPAARQQLDTTLYTAAEALRIATALLAPVLPESTPKIWAQLGMPEPIERVRLDHLQWGGLLPGQEIGTVVGVFPRIEIKEAVARMQELEVQATAEQAALLGKKPEPVTDDKNRSSVPPLKISIDDFAKVDLRVGLVLSAERVKGSDKLMLMKVDIGEPAPRTIVAGIAEAYTPEQLLNRKVAIVANLQPRKLKGIESNGMIVAASVEGGKPVLAGFHEDIPPGARLK
jgi:methionyl-tRNA synthetase